MTDYLVCPSEDAEALREALGRLYLLPPDGAGEWPRPNHTTQYYCDPRPSADATQAAFGPRDEFLETTLGKTVPCGAGDFAVPAAFESLEPSWFPIEEDE